jgi:hypothetical protein
MFFFLDLLEVSFLVYYLCIMYNLLDWIADSRYKKYTSTDFLLTGVGARMNESGGWGKIERTPN